ncbi:MAG: hypothetical protein ABIH34_07215 [Nanoarchaeota archaeon]
MIPKLDNIGASSEPEIPLVEKFRGIESKIKTTRIEEFQLREILKRRESNDMLNDYLNGGESLWTYFDKAVAGEATEEQVEQLYDLIGEVPIVDYIEEFKDFDPVFPYFIVPSAGALLGVLGSVLFMYKIEDNVSFSRRKFVAATLAGLIGAGTSQAGKAGLAWALNKQNAAIAGQNLTYLETTIKKLYNTTLTSPPHDR